MSDEVVYPDAAGEIIPSFEQLNDDEKALIDETILKIKGIINNSAISLMEEVGELLINNFFDSDYEQARKIQVNNDNTSKAQIFRVFIEKSGIKDDDDKCLKKTWLYNAINIALDKHFLEKSEHYDLYMNLTVSHKIELIPDKNEDKIKFAQDIVKNKWSVRQLREAKKNKAGTSTYTPGLITYALHPEKIDDVDEIEIKIGKEKKEIVLKKANATIDKLKLEISNLNRNLKKLEDLKIKVENHIPQKPGRKKDN